ncbi:MAG: serine hydrolase [Acidobacteria bacterium]|nr:serine hydrolase [Acidobacteriota bacterium]
MKILVRLFVRLWISLVLVASLSAVAFSQSDAELGSTVDKYLSIRSDMGGFSGAVLIVRNGKTIIRKGYGFADVEKRTPYTPETRHEVASISKMFTSAAVIKLRDMRRLTLDDPICKFVDDCPAAWQPISIGQLMDHTSGIPDYESKLGLGSDKYLEFMQKPDASKRIIDEAKALPLDFAPGKDWNYSNTGYILLSRIVERVAKEPFAKFIQKELLKPAGMKDSGVIDSTHLPAKLAAPYSYSDLAWDKTLAGVPLTDGHLKRLPQLSLTSPEGDAFLYTTVDDLYKWAQVVTGEKAGVLTSEDLKEILTPNSSGYGFGWFVGKGFDRKRYRHTGGLPGYISDFAIFPDDKITIILFSNLDRARLSNTMRDVSAIMLGTPYDMPVRGKVVTLSDEQFQNLTGVFKMADGKTLTVSKKPGDMLTAELEGRFTAGLIPLSDREFYFPLGDGKAIFTLGEDGKAVSVNMRYSGEDHIAKR